MNVTPSRSRQRRGLVPPASARCQQLSASSTQGPANPPSSCNVNDSGSSWTVIRNMFGFLLVRIRAGGILNKHVQLLTDINPVVRPLDGVQDLKHASVDTLSVFPSQGRLGHDI